MNRKVRLATPDDASQIAAIYAPYVLDTPISFELEPPTEAMMRSTITNILTRMPWLVCENENGVVGYSYASAHHARAAYRWSVDVAIYIDRDHRRMGIGKALYSALLPVLAELNYYSAIAGITLPNAGSVGLHEAMGFAPVAVYPNVGYKLGQWYDVGWWQKTLRELDEVPREPIALPQFCPSRLRELLGER